MYIHVHACPPTHGLREAVVPEDGGLSGWGLGHMHDDHHGEGDGLHRDLQLTTADREVSAKQKRKLLLCYHLQ